MSPFVFAPRLRELYLRGMRTLAVLLLACGLSQAWTVTRSASTAPAILSWEFFEEPGEGAWDSAEILIRFHPGAAIVSRILAWPGEGPWSLKHPRLVWDSGSARLTAWRGSAEGWDPRRAAPMVTFSAELTPGGAAGFDEVEAEVAFRGFGPAAAAARPASAPLAREGSEPEGRDVLGRSQGQARAWKWRFMMSTMRGEALPSP